MNTQYLTIHSTANLKSTAQNERDNLNRIGNNSSTGFHIVVDEKEAIECIPLDMVTYHAGDGCNGIGNNTSIGIEMCESGDRERVISNTVCLVASMLKERGWGINRLRRHYDWSKKLCPRILSADNWKGWHGFKTEVEMKMKNVCGFESDAKVIYKGKTMKAGILSGKTYVELRVLAEELGLKVYYDGITKTVVLS